jgi:hypothetical protein
MKRLKLRDKLANPLVKKTLLPYKLLLWGHPDHMNLETPTLPVESTEIIIRYINSTTYYLKNEVYSSLLWTKQFIC